MTIDLSLSDENRLVQSTVREYAAAEIEPHIREWDEKHEVHREVFERMAELGFLGAPIPEEFGGAGLDYVSLGILCEELERADTAFRVVMSVHVGLNSLTLLQWGSDYQKQHFLVPQAKGEKLATFGLTEPGVGTDAANLATTARRDGDSYVLNGAKMWISLADVADHFLVFATLDRAQKHRSITAFIVERGMPGFTTGTIHGKLGIRASDTAEIAFEDVRVPQSNLVGKEGKGFYQLMHFFDTTRIMVAAQGLGLAEACLDTSVKYCKERTAFGTALGNYQLTQKKLTEMAIMIEALRGLVYKSGWLVDNGTPDFTLAAMAKFYSGQTAVFCANNAVELHGGYGYIDEYSVQKWYRDAKILELYEGTKEAEIMTVGRALMSK